jgi:cobaltochelatase CobS
MKTSTYKIREALGVDKDSSVVGGVAGDTRIPAVDPNYCMSASTRTIVHYAIQREFSRKAGAHRVGLALAGPKGSGKTSAVEQYCARLNIPLLAVTANHRSELRDWIATKELVDGDTIDIEGPLLQSMREGIPFLVNEVNLVDPGELTGLNDIVERGTLVLDSGETVTAERGFVVIVTMNPPDTGNYAGAQSMNAAFLDRFFYALVDYPTEEEEMQILKAVYPHIQDKTLSKLVKVAAATRADTALQDPMSTRGLIRWVELLAVFRQTGDPTAVKRTLGFVYTNALPQEQGKAVGMLVDRVFGQSQSQSA